MNKVKSVTMLQLNGPQQAIEVISRLASMLKTTIDDLQKVAQGTHAYANTDQDFRECAQIMSEVLDEQLAEVMKTCSVDLPEGKMEELKALAARAKGATPEELDKLIKETVQKLGVDMIATAVPRPATLAEDAAPKVHVKGSKMLH